MQYAEAEMARAVMQGLEKAPLRILAVYPLILVLAGCAATTGSTSLQTQNTATIDSQLARGVSTKADVEKAFGEPIDKSCTVVSADCEKAGNEIWYYSYSSMKDKSENYIPWLNLLKNGQEFHDARLVVIFDTAGLVKDFKFSASDRDVPRGLLGD